VRDANLRMGIYRRLGSGSEPSEKVIEELADRFGPPPPSVRRLAALADLKALAESLRVQSISSQRGQLVIRFRRDARVDVEALTRMLAERHDTSFSPSGVLKIPAPDRSRWLETASASLHQVAGGAA
jgi:transcription-repair coupling factor (superfamily II helicase)